MHVNSVILCNTDNLHLGDKSWFEIDLQRLHRRLQAPRFVKWVRNIQTHIILDHENQLTSHEEQQVACVQHFTEMWQSSANGVRCEHTLKLLLTFFSPHHTEGNWNLQFTTGRLLTCSPSLLTVVLICTVFPNISVPSLGFVVGKVTYLARLPIWNGLIALGYQCNHWGLQQMGLGRTRSQLSWVFLQLFYADLLSSCGGKADEKSSGMERLASIDVLVERNSK